MEIDGLNIWDSISQNKTSGRSEVLLNMRSPDYLAPDYYDDFSSKQNYVISDSTFDDFFVIRSENWKFFSGKFMEQGWTSKNKLADSTDDLSGHIGEGIKLYDLSEDPREERNVAAENPDIVEEMLAKIPGYEEKMSWVLKRNRSLAASYRDVWSPWVNA